MFSMGVQALRSGDFSHDQTTSVISPSGSAIAASRGVFTLGVGAERVIQPSSSTFPMLIVTRMESSRRLSGFAVGVFAVPYPYGERIGVLGFVVQRGFGS